MPDRTTILRELIDLLETETGEQVLDLDETRKLREELGLDSVDVVSLVSQVERRYRIRFSQEELQTLVTIGDVISLLQTKITLLSPSEAA